MTENRQQGQVLRRYDRSRPRDVTPSFDHGDTFERQRELAEQYPCEAPPRGCGAEVGQRCRVVELGGKVRPDLVLTRRPAHLPRLRAAGLAPPSTVGTGQRRETDRPDGAPVPEQNRHLYADIPTAPECP
jgi:hypothetical protein